MELTSNNYIASVYIYDSAFHVYLYVLSSFGTVAEELLNFTIPPIVFYEV